MNHSKRLIHFAFKEYVASKDDREYVMKITNLTSFTFGDSICVEFCSFNTRNEMFTDILDSGCKTVDEVEKLDTYNRYVVKRHKLYDMCVEPENKDEVVR